MDFFEFKEKIEKVRSKPIVTFDYNDIPAEEIADFDKLPKNPDISVLTITYNHSSFIRQYLESVLNQKFDGTYEIVIGEDCSTDDTRAILIEYQKKYPEKIRIVYSENNVGVAPNLFRTLQKCRGKYIALIEGDDFWHSDLKLAKQFSYMEEHPECSVVYSDSNELMMATGELKLDVMHKRGIYERETAIDAKALLTDPRLWLNTCTIFASSEAFKKVFFTTPLFSMHLLLSDLALRIDLANYGKVAVLPDSLATYRVNSPGSSACRISDPVKSVDFYIDAWLTSFYYGPKFLTDNELYQLNVRFAKIISGQLSLFYAPETVKKFRSLLDSLNIKSDWKTKIYLAMGKYRLLNQMGKIFRKLKGL